MNILAQETTDRFTIAHGDCVDVMRGLPDESVGYSIFSPPFEGLFVYSASPRDFGNCVNSEEFAAHMQFLVPELMRILKPGRLLSFHCMLIPSSKSQHGYIGLRDFRGDLIRAFQRHGFIFHSEVCIWKDPVTAMQRTKALGLLHKTIRKDSAMSRQGVPDYLVTMRKPGTNPDPIEHTAEEYPVSLWQRVASPVWVTTRGEDDEGFAICQGDDDGTDSGTVPPQDTLQRESAREERDERHICLARGSLVLTRDGYIPIQEVEVGDMVLTHKGRWMPVTAKVCNGVRDVIRLTAHGVANLRLTPNHRVWTRKASGKKERASAMSVAPTWMEADETRGSYLNLKLPPMEESNLDAQDWWIVGRWLGDGHLTVRGLPFITGSYRETDSLLAQMGKRAGGVYNTGTANQVYVKGSGGLGGHHDDPLHLMIKRCGSGASKKRVPVEAMSLNPALSESLLAGYLSADGHRDKLGRWHATSVSRALSLGMAIVAQRARETIASVYAGRKGGESTIMGRRVNTQDEWKFMISENNRSAFLAVDGAWKKVREIVGDGRDEVWDIQVAEDESFTAEGCIVHNCPLQLEVIRRALRLWTRPDDVVLSPFAGIGSEGYVALQEGRRFVGCELKGSYFKQAVRNLHAAQRSQGKQTTLAL